MNELVPTERLRFVKREVPVPGATPIELRILQQWYAIDMPKYMRSGEGEWRDVPLMTE